MFSRFHRRFIDTQSAWSDILRETLYIFTAYHIRSDLVSNHLVYVTHCVNPLIPLPYMSMRYWNLTHCHLVNQTGNVNPRALKFHHFHHSVTKSCLFSLSWKTTCLESPCDSVVVLYYSQPGNVSISPKYSQTAYLLK